MDHGWMAAKVVAVAVVGAWWKLGVGPLVAGCMLLLLLLHDPSQAGDWAWLLAALGCPGLH